MLKYLSKFLYVLPARRSHLILLLLIFVSVSSLEVIGIGLIGPFIALATNSEIINQNQKLNWIYTNFNFSSPTDFIVAGGIFITLLFCIKSVISWIVQTYVFKFSYTQRKDLVDRLLSVYLSAPYTSIIAQNSAEIINKINGGSMLFANSILSTLLTSCANVIMIVAISTMLCFVSPIAVLSLLFVAFPLFLLLKLFKRKTHYWGQELYESSKEIYRHINHGLGGFKESRVIGCESYFREQCVDQAQRYADASVGFYGLKLLPRFFVETMLVIFLVGFTSVSIMLGQDIQEMASTLSIFALAAIRLIPAVSNLTGGLAALRTSRYALDQIYFDLKDLENVKSSDAEVIPPASLVDAEKFNPNHRDLDRIKNEIVLDRVVYRYPNATEVALKEISLKIKKGESIALIGKSGAGKTTLVDVILGLLVPQAGDIKVDGQSIYRNLRSWQSLIGYIPQSIFLLDDTIEKNIAFGVPEHLIDETRLNQAIQAAQLEQVIAKLPKGIKTSVGERGVLLSGGQRQRVGIARSLYHGSDVLVLDEATSALDNETESLVTEAIKSLSGTKTMIIIAHRLTTIEHCDCVYVMSGGKIVDSGSYEEIVVQGKSSTQLVD